MIDRGACGATPQKCRRGGMASFYRDGSAAATVRRNDEATTDMANIPQKTKDPTEEALTAIQEALNIRAPETRSGSLKTVTDTNPVNAPAPSDLFAPDSPTPWPASDAPRRAANDDRAGIGQILQILRYRSARTPYVAAAICSFVWIAGGTPLSPSMAPSWAVSIRNAGYWDLPASLLSTAAIGRAGDCSFSCSPTCSTVLKICVLSLN